MLGYQKLAVFDVLPLRWFVPMPHRYFQEALSTSPVGRRAPSASLRCNHATSDSVRLIAETSLAGTCIGLSFDYVRYLPPSAGPWIPSGYPCYFLRQRKTLVDPCNSKSLPVNSLLEHRERPRKPFFDRYPYPDKTAGASIPRETIV